jgi:hypothetical protein
MISLPPLCAHFLERIHKADWYGIDLDESITREAWGVTIPTEDAGARQVVGLDALRVLQDRGLIERNWIGFGEGGQLYRDPTREDVEYLVTDAGVAALREHKTWKLTEQKPASDTAPASARESEVVDNRTDADATSWLDRLRVSLARRGPQLDKDGRRRWTLQDVAVDAGVHRSTIARSQEAVRLLRAAKTARTRAGFAQSDGDSL